MSRVPPSGTADLDGGAARTATSWADVEVAVPELAARVRRRFTARTHLTMATVRADGAPRISGIEVTFRDGQLWIGLMPGSVKAQDLARDPRLALHSPTVDPPTDDPSRWPGEAKLAGVALDGEGTWFGHGPSAHDVVETGGWVHLDVREAVLTTIAPDPDRLVIESWHPGHGDRRRERT